MATLTSTESTIVDLVALKNWHFQASLDKKREPSTRRWHRSQVRAITTRLEGIKGRTQNQTKIAFINFLALEYRKKLHARAGQVAPFAWERLCKAARKRIAEDARHSP
jgi:hypothetical protein